MSTPTPSFNTEVIGQWTEPVEFEVTRERIQAYAAATNDPIAPHVAGDHAPPVFAIVPAFQTATGAALKVVPEELIMMIVHGEQDFRFHAPVLPDTTVTTRAAAIGMHPRSSGVTVTVKAETHGPAGQLLVDLWSKAPGVLAYETVADDGAVAIKDGLAEIRR